MKGGSGQSRRTSGKLEKTGFFFGRDIGADRNEAAHRQATPTSLADLFEGQDPNRSFRDLTDQSDVRQLAPIGQCAREDHEFPPG